MQASSPPASANSNGMDPVPQFAEYLSHFGDNHPPIEKAASHAIQFHSIRSDIHTSFMNFLIQKVIRNAPYEESFWELRLGRIF